MRLILINFLEQLESLKFFLVSTYDCKIRGGPCHIITLVNPVCRNLSYEKDLEEIKINFVMGRVFLKFTV